ncbi:FIST C-terminal domain-containing protein [bacterium]|nr:FIST C-terminal domain-containing protein [bacterium]
MALIDTTIGVSQKENLIEAAREAAKMAQKGLHQKPKLLMFFVTMGVYSRTDYQKALKEIYEVFGNNDIPLVGGPVIGFFTSDRYYFDISLIGKYLGSILKGVEKIFKPFRNFGVAVIAIYSEYLFVGTGIGSGVFKNPERASRDSIKMALDNLEYNPSIAYLAMVKKGIKDITRFRPLNGFILTPGNSKNGFLFDQALIEGITSITKRTTRLIGGGLCSGVKIKKEGFEYLSPSVQFFNKNIYYDSVISVIFGSDLEIGYGTATGAVSLGKVLVVTKSSGHTVEEIDGKPAAKRLRELYKEIGFKEDPLVVAYKGVLPAFSEGISGFLWPVMPVAYSGQKIIFMSSIKEGTILTISKIDRNSCIKAISEAVNLMKDDINTDDFNFIFYFSCPIRARILGKDYMKEIIFLKRALGKENIPIFGICSAGEIAFYKLGAPFGATATITMMGVSNRLVSEVLE